MEIAYKNIDQIMPYDKNPRKNEKAIDVVAKSIKEFGFLVPVILDKKNTIIAGHTRIKAAAKIGLKQIPCIYADNLTEEQVKAFRIMENKSQEYAKWDLRLLVDELMDLQVANIDLSITGIPEIELNRLLGENEEKIKGDREPKYKIKKGDIYQLGKHKILCGDSTKEESYHFITEPIDIIFTDPPYGVSYTGQTYSYKIENPTRGKDKKWELIQGDDLRGEQLYNFLKSAFTEMNKKLINKGAVYCFYASRNHIIFERALNDAGITVKQVLIWNKHHVLGRSDYHWCHEPILYAHKTGQNCTFYGDRIEKTILNKPITQEELNKLNEKEVRKILKSILINSDLWTEKKDPATKYIHPTQKPTSLAKRAIINSTPLNGTVLDPFAGSGSTLMACEQLKRKCYTIEYDEKFVSHIIERWEDETKQKAVKIN